jgi:hypothetical protein
MAAEFRLVKCSGWFAIVQVQKNGEAAGYDAQAKKKVFQLYDDHNQDASAIDMAWKDSRKYETPGMAIAAANRAGIALEFAPDVIPEIDPTAERPERWNVGGISLPMNGDLAGIVLRALNCYREELTTRVRRSRLAGKIDEELAEELDDATEALGYIDDKTTEITDDHRTNPY